MSVGEQGAADDPRPVREILSNCLDAVRNVSSQLEYELSEASDMQSESTNAVVRFRADDSSNHPTLNVMLLLEQLREDTVIAAIDLCPSPPMRLVISGARRNHNYRIVVEL